MDSSSIPRRMVSPDSPSMLELDFVAVGGEYAPDGDGVDDVLAGVGHGVSLTWLGCGHPVRPLVAVLQGMHSGPW